MSGTLKVGGKTLATHDTYNNVAKIQLGSTSDVVLTDSAGNNVLSESSGVVTLDNVNQTFGNKKYFIQGKISADSAQTSGSMLFVAGTTNPYFSWVDSLSNAGFDVGSSSNYDFKFTKKGIYFVGFSATFRHVTTNSSRNVYGAIRGLGSTSESTNVLASALDQIAQADSTESDYGNLYVSLVKEFSADDLINFYTLAGPPAQDAVRSIETHVSIYLIRAT